MKVTFGTETINVHEGVLMSTVLTNNQCCIEGCLEDISVWTGEKAYPFLWKDNDGRIQCSAQLCEGCWEQLRTTILHEFDFVGIVENAVKRLCMDPDTKAMYQRYRNPYERLIKEIRRQMKMDVDEYVNQHPSSCGESVISAVA